MFQTVSYCFISEMFFLLWYWYAESLHWSASKRLDEDGPKGTPDLTNNCAFSELLKRTAVCAKVSNEWLDSIRHRAADCRLVPGYFQAFRSNYSHRRRRVTAKRCVRVKEVNAFKGVGLDKKRNQSLWANWRWESVRSGFPHKEREGSRVRRELARPPKEKLGLKAFYNTSIEMSLLSKLYKKGLFVPILWCSCNYRWMKPM